MNDKIVLITGGTGGIGKQTAKALAKLGAQVIITGRDKGRGLEAVREIKSETGGKADLLLGDLGSLAGIRQLAKDFQAKYPRLDVLINNVGLLEGQKRLTADGLEAHFAVNVVAPFLLTHLLLSSLKQSKAARVINLTGGMPSGSIDLGNLQAEKSFVGLPTYSHAKMVMSAMSLGFARRLEAGGASSISSGRQTFTPSDASSSLEAGGASSISSGRQTLTPSDASSSLEGTGITLNVAYPGAAGTAMTHAMTAEFLPPWMRLFWPIFKLVMREDGGKAAAKAAHSSVYLASSPEVEGLSGGYYDTKARRVQPHPSITNPENQKQIWQKLEQITGISEQSLVKS